MQTLIRFVVLMALGFGSWVFAGSELVGRMPVLPDEKVPGYLARIELNDPLEVEAALQRAEDVYLSDEIPENVPPVVFVLHGPEVAVFQKHNYQRYKPIVDLAARLSAFRVVDIRICRTQLYSLGGGEQELHPFVGTVPYGPAEVQRLLDVEHYVYF